MKRIVMILGGKGGTGKTAFTRLLLDVLHTKGSNYLAYDADTENPELYEYYQQVGTGVRLLNFLEVAEAKRLFTEIKTESPDVVVLDMPGASGNKTREIIKKFGLFKIAADLGYRVTLVTVINLGYSVITSLKVMAEFCGDKADYVVVKNLCWDKGLGFQRWEASKRALSSIGTKNRVKEIKLNFQLDAAHVYTKVKWRGSVFFPSQPCIYMINSDCYLRTKNRVKDALVTHTLPLKTVRARSEVLHV